MFSNFKTQLRTSEMFSTFSDNLAHKLVYSDFLDFLVSTEPKFAHFLLQELRSDARVIYFIVSLIFNGKLGAVIIW
jgi:hypothetical protein